MPFSNIDQLISKMTDRLIATKKIMELELPSFHNDMSGLVVP